MISPPPPNKTRVREQILAELRNYHQLQLRAAQVSRDEATNEESRAENKYDMHSQEAAYLAEGQAKLAADIAASMEIYAALPVSAGPSLSGAEVGSLVAIENAGTVAWHFLGPRAGGLELNVDGCDVLVLTPQSPFGRELLGKRVGDLVRVPGRPPTLRPVVALA